MDSGSNKDEIKQERIKDLFARASLLQYEFEQLSDHLNKVKSLAEQFGFKKTVLNVKDLQNRFLQAHFFTKKELDELINKD